MLHCLGGLPTAAIPVWYVRHPALVEVMSEPYLSCAHLDDDCAECPVETPMHLQDLFGRGWCQLIHCPSMQACLPIMFLQRVYCFPNFGFYCCSEKPLLNWSGGCCCSYGFSHPALDVHGTVAILSLLLLPGLPFRSPRRHCVRVSIGSLL